MRPTSASPDNIDAVTLTGSVMRSLPRLALLALTVGALTFAVLSLVAPRYQSEAQLTIDAKTGSNPFADPKQAGTPSDTTASRMDREAINTHIRALQSPALAGEIVSRLKLAEQVEFNSELGDVDQVSKVLRMIGLAGTRAGQSEQDRVLEAYFANLNVFAARESRYISLRFTSVDPALAAEIPNALADAYRAQLASRQVEETQDVQDALGPKVQQLTKDVAAADIAVEQFRGKVDAFNTGAQKQSLNEQQLGELTNELSKAQAARSEAEARAGSARDMLRGGSGEVLPDVQKSPLIQNLVQQRVRVERQIAELNATLLPGHPRMQQLNADLAGLKKQITAEVSKIVDGLAKEAKVAVDREASIKKRLGELKTTVVNAGPDEAKLKTLMADAKAKRDELERLQAQFNANKSRVESKAVPVEAKLVSPATASSVPVFPKKGPLSAIAAVASFVLGLAFTILRGVSAGARAGSPNPGHPTHDRRKSDGATAAARGAASTSNAGISMAPAPAMSATDSDSGEVAAPAVVASIDTLVQHIAARTPERGGFRSLVVGETERTDGSASAIALAKGLAAAGQPTILIEWSFGDSAAARALGLPAKPGLAELISGSSGFEDVISGIDSTECHFIAAGSTLAGADDADQVNLVLDALDEAYAHIVVTGEHAAARQLFELIQGRFDAGILAGTDAAPAALRDPDGTFLGFEVADIEIIRLKEVPGKGNVSRRLRNRELVQS
jgi:uncharacterized protein involved in exopolysaccharide biosynthesis